ncbi:MAG: zinc ribbon domain-containing protein [Clostridiales bacterium]|nr:zinc ribbon domain-containing protein [Clostridiales bacterium]
MGKYCVKCGNVLHDGARFCAGCGTSVDVPMPAPRPVQAGFAAPSAAQTWQQYPANTVKGKKGKSVLCILLAVLLAVQTAVVALYGWPGFAVKTKAKSPGVLSSSSFNLQEWQTSVKTDDGVIVDFGCLLNAGEEITVQKVEPAPVDSDVEIFAYNFELSSGQPDGAIELTIPYDDAGLSEEEEQLSVCGKYFSNETGEWENVFYTVDTQNNTVTILTDHLSMFSAFKIVDETKRSAYISEVNVYTAYMTLEQADALIKTYAAQEPAWQENVAASYLSAVNTLPYFAESNMHTLLSLGGAYSDLVSKPFQSAMTNLGIATACVQFVYDAYHNGLIGRQTAMSAMKSTLSIALNFATAPIQLAYLGVGVIDLALTEVSSYAVESRYESTKNMYDDYYRRDGVRRTVGDWRRLFKTIYKENQSKPQEALNMMNTEIDRYVQEYWTVAGADWDSWIDAYDDNATLSKYPWPYEEDRNNISNTYKEELYSYLETVFYTIGRDIYFDSLDAQEKELTAMARLLNTQYSIKIVEKAEEGESPEWAGCYARLAPLSESADENAWTGKLDDEGGGTIVFTLLAHQRAGFPMTLELFKTADDVKDGKVALSVPLEPFEENVQIVILGNEGLSLDEIIGEYALTTTFEGESQQLTAVFSKNGNKLSASSDADEPFDMTYDPATGTAYVSQTHSYNEEDDVFVETTFVFTLEDGTIKLTGHAIMSITGQAITSTVRYEGYKLN